MNESETGASPKRYFYSDRLAAAWMIEQFGMELEPDKECQFWEEDGKPMVGAKHFFIRPDSLHLLKHRSVIW